MTGDKARYERVARHKMSSTTKKTSYRDQVSREPGLLAQMVCSYDFSKSYNLNKVTSIV